MMVGITLSSAVEDFARKAAGYSTPDLECPWSWQDYEEGVRFAFFRLFQELRQLAVDLAFQRRTSGQPPTHAHHVLAQYHAAYRDLQAVLAGVQTEFADQPPADEEWSIQQAIAHMAHAERSFYFTVSYALRRARGGSSLPMEPEEETWKSFLNQDPLGIYPSELAYPDLLVYFDALHQRVLDDFASISAAELAFPSKYWENTLMPVQFRLHRFEAHLRQHTVQIEKTLELLGRQPSEAHRLLRLIYQALAEVEGVLIGSRADTGAGSLQSLAGEVARMTQEVESAVAAAGRAYDRTASG